MPWQADMHEASAAALHAPGRTPLSHAALAELVSGTAAGLRASGLRPEARIALMIRNGPEAAASFLAVSAAAAVAPLNPTYGEEELAFYLEDIHADAIVVAATLETPARDVARARGIRVLDLHADESAPAGAFTLDGIGPMAPMPQGPSPDAVALMLHTSGTTSRPKLVPLTHRQLRVSAGNVARTLQLSQSDRCLNVMPLFHIHGLVAALLASLEVGASVACCPIFHQLRFFDWFEELKPTWYSAVPTMHAAVVARAADHRASILDHRLRFIRSSSAALPTPVLDGLEGTFGVPVIEAYGMTEAAHQMASNRLPPETRKPGTVGRAAGPEIAVLGERGDLLPPGVIGEVVIRGENVFSGYEANPAANEAAFVDGWFRTGDEGFLDDDGFLTLRGRIKEVINRGGEKISPLEIDDVLLRHEAVAQAVTFAMADPRLGEEIAAAVVLAPDRQTDERSLQDFVVGHLAPFKVPRRIVVLDEIPKGPTGKVQRIGLAERLGVEPVEIGGDDRLPAVFLESELIDIWESVLDVTGIGINDDFFALGGDSILGAEAVARVRDLVDDQDIPLISIVRAPTPAAMAQEVFAGLGRGRSGVVPLQAAGGRTPLFLVHPRDGDVLAFAVLARRLGPDQPSYGLRAPGIDDGTEIPPSLVEMATGYVAGIRRVQPRGPYLLGGLSIGGAIAVEMAFQLDEAGEEVAMLALLDPRFALPADLGQGVPRTASRPARADGPVQVALDRLSGAHATRPFDFPATVVCSEEFAGPRVPNLYPQGDLETVIRNPRSWTTIRSIHTRLLLPPAVDAVAAEIRPALDEVAESGRTHSSR